MNICGLMIFISLILTIQCAREEEIEELSSIIRNFTARVAAYLVRPPFGYPDNFIFSGFRIVFTLVTMYSMGSDKTRSEIKTVLGLSSSLEANICDVMNEISTYDPINRTVTSVLFNSTVFYRPGMKIREEAVRSPCISGNIEPIDFSNTTLANKTINDFYNVWRERFYGRYLEEPLDPDTNEFYMNLMRTEYVFDPPFYHGWFFLFTDIYGEEFILFSMKKIADFSFEYYEKHNVTLIREDLVGDRFYSVVILPNYTNIVCEEEFYSYLETDVFTDILLEAASLRNKTRMGVKMPDLYMKSRFDVMDVLNDMGMTSFAEETAFSRLTDDPTNITQFPHSEFIRFVALKSNPNESDDNEYFEVTRPFIFVLMDKKFDVPLKTFLYSGLEVRAGLLL